MFRNSMLVASLMVLSAMATTAGAAVNKLPHDDCQKWEKREVMKNYWLKRHKVDRWYCVVGESKEHAAPDTLKGPSMAGKPRGNTPGSADTPDNPQTPETTTTSSTDTPPGDDEPGKGNNGRGTPNGGPTDGGDPPGGGNTGNDGEG